MGFKHSKIQEVTQWSLSSTMAPFTLTSKQTVLLISDILSEIKKLKHNPPQKKTKKLTLKPIQIDKVHNFFFYSFQKLSGSIVYLLFCKFLSYILISLRKGLLYSFYSCILFCCMDELQFILSVPCWWLYVVFTGSA